MPDNGQHFVAVVGGAISGSVAAEILADRGIRVAVIEQNKRPTEKSRTGCRAGTSSSASRNMGA